MPLDRKKQRLEAEQELSTFVEKRDPFKESENIFSNVQAGQSQFLDPIASRISGMTGLPSSARSKLRPFTRETKKFLNRNTIQQQKQKLQRMYDTVYENAVAAGLDENMADEFARRIAQQTRDQQFTSSEAEKGRINRQKLENTADYYSKRGLELEDKYSQNNNYTSALLRVLLGTGTSIGTSAYLNKLYLNKQNQQLSGLNSKPSTAGTGGVDYLSLYTPKTQTAGMNGYGGY